MLQCCLSKKLQAQGTGCFHVLPGDLSRFIASKGSVALDGISLTVNEVEQNRFGINVIPHTLTHTTWSAKKPGDRVNLEVDVFARYVARAMEFRS